ncbi:acetate--CoA ligase [Spirilliplanes yamanashiensis]|uniref:acetate--CoA ligase n=1 Tax=Spirilliplanes yamanashiensis TaxID=42233 RepID=A0A8J4DM61_9ACTN|nr:acetate--CoA ligase [Spirilliplanes yamanashiensis]MDP9818300.1 acetyl-CoA synthetase [Spirilliplanes yamanashiensis]GIJ06716.1 acetyl-coenzyme A synthetase [Spirilliplanes yamanashiensis]
MSSPWKPVLKTPAERARANLSLYAWARHDFTWEHARRDWLHGLPGGGLNIGYETVDRHLGTEHRYKTALRCLDRRGVTTELTYAELGRSTGRFANLLGRLGVRRGDRVFLLLPRGPDLYVAALGTLRFGAVLSPLFPAFGPEPVRERIDRGDGVVLVTTPELYAAKVAPVRDRLPGLRHVLVTGDDRPPAGTLSLGAMLAGADERWVVGATDPGEMALLHFTSGTTGRPKGAVHVHEAVVAHYATALYALDLHPDDVFWCTADPGWVTGTSYSIVAPLAHGLTVVVDAGEFDAQRWYRTLEQERVTVWYTAPTALRMLMRHGTTLARGHDLSALRFVASVGEPLNPEVVVWGQQALGRPVHDNWWQTETGAIMISNFAGLEIRPGSMGRPLPGVEVALLDRGEDGRARLTDGHVGVIAEPGAVGELALRPGWPSMFRGYLHEPERYARCFADGWYLSGDLARQDADGYFWFVGRGDDVIKSAGHLIGPFEVENVLMEHPTVAEAGVIGRPDPVAGEVVKAFVTLRPGVERSDDLRLELLGFARRRLGGLAPKEIVFDDHLPHTRSGKVMRRLLRARELGLPEGDLSTLESTR